MSCDKGTLLVTGASGYVGSRIVHEALARGYKVRVTARTEASARKAVAGFPAHAARLSYAVVPDITVAASYEAALAGGSSSGSGSGSGDGDDEDAVTGVIHSASPFVLKPEDNVRDLLDPAVRGCTAVLEAVDRWGPSVTRVVATSSFASIVDLSRGLRPGYTYTEADWNPVTFDEAAAADGVTAYCASKALAERAMYDWVAEHQPRFTIATVCPPWVFGPYASAPTGTGHLSESLSLLNDIIDADGIPPFDFGGFGDVREVAAAHILAFEKPEAANQRFLVGQPFRYQLAVDAAREAFPELRDRLPEGKPGYIEPAYTPDGSKAARVLGIKYRPLAETVKDTYAQLLQARQTESAAA